MGVKKRVVVGLSGGVDSSVTAYLLKEAGYEVIGLFMKNWHEEGECPAQQDYEDALHISNHLKIPCYTVNFTQEYWDKVFSHCLKQFEKGFTPNPDILCNQEIKFKLFFEKAIEFGADYLATGHYAKRVQLGSRYYLARGEDVSKDQSYFLYTMKEKTLDRVLFPLATLQKNEVRKIAKEIGLVTAQKKDSVGICFIGKRPFKEFISQYLPKRPGHFENLSGKVLGQHDGAYFYTIGQRRGLNIGGQSGGNGEGWYVVGKDMARGVVFVQQGDEHEALHHRSLSAFEASWITDVPQFPLRCTAKIRYRSPDEPCEVYQLLDGSLRVDFDQPQKAITPYQSIVFYQDQICLGGALITSALVR